MVRVYFHDCWEGGESMDKETKQKRINKYMVILLSLILVILLASACSNNTEKKESKEAVAVSTSADSIENISDELANVSCVNCHEMKPEVTTWQVSSHSKVPCETCHEVDIDDYQDKHRNESYSLPIKISQKIGDATCKECHVMENRLVTPSGDLIIPHAKHAEMGVPCAACHSGVVHGDLNKRKITVKEEYSELENWTLATAEEVAIAAYRQPGMWTCLNCHKSFKLTTECAACHQEIDGLPSHDASNWRVAHGVSGRESPNSCIECHKTPGEPTTVTPSTGDRIADFALATMFCYNCHNQLPESHKEPWLPKHPGAAMSKGRTNCIACHSLNEPTAKETVTTTYCNDCHWFKQ